MADTSSIEEAIARVRRDWMQVDGVVAIGIGRTNESPCVRVYFRDSEGMQKAALPASIDGHPVIKEVSGSIEAW